MGDLSKRTDQEKVWFLQAALLDAAYVLRNHDPEAAERYSGYVREMNVKEPSP